MLLNGGELDGRRYLSKETCALFTTDKSKISRRGLGFDKPDVVNEGKVRVLFLLLLLYMGIPDLQEPVPG